MRGCHRVAPLGVLVCWLGLVAPQRAAAQVETGGLSVGADVTLLNVTDTIFYSQIGGINGYAFGSNTCNVGNQALRFGFSWNTSPVLAMNAYRLHDGRLVQIGQSWVKGACCAAQGNGCGLGCIQGGSGFLGIGCLDTYSASFNGGQTRMGPRSAINAFTGAIPNPPGTSGSAIDKRLQIAAADINPANFPGALYFIEGVYVGSDDAPNGNALNNASYKRVTFSGNTMTVVGAMLMGTPAIQAWRDHGNGVNTPDNTVQIMTVNVPSEGRFVAACKVRDNGNGTWRYDYAIFNLNSDRSGGSFNVPVPAGVSVANVGFKDVNYHSGEPLDNTDWISTVDSAGVTWRSPQTFAQNPNSNALRWGTMYNYWFDANQPPTSGQVTLGLFKPHSPSAVNFSACMPQAAPQLLGDMNCDGVVSPSDIGPFVLALTDPFGYAAAFPACDIHNADINGDNLVTVGDIGGFVALFGK